MIGNMRTMSRCQFQTGKSEPCLSKFNTDQFRTEIAVLLGLESGFSLTHPICHSIQLRRNMRSLESLGRLRKSRWLLAASLVLLPQLLFAQWTVSVGAESGDQGRQALAFLPNEIWIHVGDSITWKLVTK